MPSSAAPTLSLLYPHTEKALGKALATGLVGLVGLVRAGRADGRTRGEGSIRAAGASRVMEPCERCPLCPLGVALGRALCRATRSRNPAVGAPHSQQGLTAAEVLFADQSCLPVSCPPSPW